MKFKIKGARLAGLLVPALALAAPAFAQTTPVTLNDSTEPGSVIVFPKFIKGTVTLPEGGTAPITELEIGVVCPVGVTCPEHEPVKIHFQWVCGTTEANLAGSFVCPEVNFDVTATVWEKIVLVPNGSAAGYSTKNIPPAPCNAGYLIGWVENLSDAPVKFDGLIGDAHLRPGAAVASDGTPSPFAGSPLTLADYNAIPIQADPALPTFPAVGSTITTNGNGALLFDGGAGHYAAVTGKVYGDIRYTNLTTGPTFTLGALTLLTLDVKSGRPNNPVFADFDFYAAPGSFLGNENVLSAGAEFICWGEFPITALSDGGAALITDVMGRKGVFQSTKAEKVQIFGITDESGPTTLLGLAEVLEGGVFPPVAPWPRASFTSLFNNSIPLATRFLPSH
jgi:hypothetical protein